MSGATAAADRPLGAWRRRGAQAALAAGLAAVVAVFLGWPSLTQADRFHENWRQSPQWQSPDKQHFQDDDLILRYSEFNTSPFGNALYKTLARTGHDIVWGKVMTIVLMAAGALLLFLLADAMAGPAAGWVAVAVFLFFPSLYEHFAGGYMACFSWPLLAAAVLVIYRRKWWWSVPLVAFSALAYPMVALHIGMMFVVDTVYHDLVPGRLADRELWRTKLLPLALAAVAVLSILGAKYVDDHGFGQLVTRQEMQDRVDFTKQGRYRILPTVPLWTRFERQWEDPFHLSLLLVAVYFLGRNAFRLPRGVYSLLVASILMYYLADVLVMRLYLPSRYLRRSLPLFTCLLAGIWWARIYHGAWRDSAAGNSRDGAAGNARASAGGRARQGAGRRPLRRLVPLAVLTVVLVGLGWREFEDEFEPGEYSHVYDRHGLYEAIRALPGRPMIAAWPKLASELPLMTGRTVLVNKEQAHPWWTDYWDEVTERTQEFWRAYYTEDPAELRRVADKYAIDYWVVEPRHFAPGYVGRRRVHYEPLNSWLRRLPRGRRPLLSRVPPAYRLYDDSRRFLVSSEQLFRWLEAP